MAGDMSGYPGQQGAMANWQGSQMSMNQFQGQQYGPQHHMNAMGAQGAMGYMGMAGQYPNHVAPNGNMMPMPYPGSLGGDVQCRDVSQSSQTKGGKSKASVKGGGGGGGGAAGAVNAATVAGGGGAGGAGGGNGALHQPGAGTASSLPCPPVDNSPTDTKAVDTKAVDTKSNSKSFMKPDTYQRTLEYVQQCHSWSSTVVKEEVTSTTDQKPKLNPNGTVAGYTGPGSQASLAVPQPQQPQQPLAAPQQPQGGSRFATPLPVALAETSNMVINDMSSSLTSLQEENKYLQMMQ